MDFIKSATNNRHRQSLLMAILLASLLLAGGCGAEKSALSGEAGSFRDALGDGNELAEAIDLEPTTKVLQTAAAERSLPSETASPSELQQTTAMESEDIEKTALTSDSLAESSRPAPALKYPSAEQEKTVEQEQRNEAVKEESADLGLENEKPAPQQVEPVSDAKAVAASDNKTSNNSSSTKALPIIGWNQFFDNEDQTTPSSTFWDLSEERQTVNIKGFMGEVLSFDKNWFLLIPEPGAECPFDNGDETYWNKIMIVFVKEGTKLRYTSKPLKLEGRLDVGIKIDESGYKTMFRLYDATFEEIKN